MTHKTLKEVCGLEVSDGGEAMSCMEQSGCLEARGREVNFKWIYAWVLLY